MDVQANHPVFARIGGAPAVRAVVDDFYTRVLADESLAAAFAGIDMRRLRDHQIAFLATALGGPNRYRGRSMAEAHTGLKITAESFARVAAHLHEALLAAGVGTAEITDILTTVASLQSDIIDR